MTSRRSIVHPSAVAGPSIDAFRAALLRRLTPLHAGEQAAYKPALALALADVLVRPAGGDGCLYGNKMDPLPGLGPAWVQVPHECAVDLAFLHRPAKDGAWRSIATAESEAWPKHAVKLPSDGDDAKDAGYFWDLFKLVHYPSPFRVFLGVVNGGSSFDALPRNLLIYAQRYEGVMRTGDRLVIVVVKNTNEPSAWLTVVEATFDGDRLRQFGEAVTSP